MANTCYHPQSNLIDLPVTLEKNMEKRYRSGRFVIKRAFMNQCHGSVFKKHEVPLRSPHSYTPLKIIMVTWMAWVSPNG